MCRFDFGMNENMIRIENREQSAKLIISIVAFTAKRAKIIIIIIISIESKGSKGSKRNNKYRQ